MRSTRFARVAATMDFIPVGTRKRDLTLLVITTIGELGSQYTNYWTLNRAQVEENNTLDDLCGDHLATYKKGCSGIQSQRGYRLPNQELYAETLAIAPEDLELCAASPAQMRLC